MMEFFLIDLVNSRHVSAWIIMINSLIAAGKKERAKNLGKYLVNFLKPFSVV